MTQNIAVWLVLVAALLGANLPFLSQRVLLVGPRQQDKAFGWRLLELVLLWLAVLAPASAGEPVGSALAAGLGVLRGHGLPVPDLGGARLHLALPATSSRRRGPGCRMSSI
jgi:hypothetical protein